MNKVCDNKITIKTIIIRETQLPLPRYNRVPLDNSQHMRQKLY
jgi:hypothetical protein